MSADGYRQLVRHIQEVEDYSVNIVEARWNKTSYHTNKFNSFGHYNIINKFIVELLRMMKL
jgi:hypothetical protein